jgi:hypothetical protein
MKLGLGRGVFVSRGPGSDTPGMRLDEGDNLMVEGDAWHNKNAQ